MSDDPTPAGLRGVSAGTTELSTVGQEGTGLTYRGYDIHDLAEKASFEEVVYLLLRGHLPNRRELDAYCAELRAKRDLPQDVRSILEAIPAATHPMDVLRTGASALGHTEAETDFESQLDTADGLIAALPSVLAYWYRYANFGERIDTDTDDDTIGGQFLHLLHGERREALHEQALQTALILYAEHEFNASTFTARVCASTLSDLHSCVTGAIGTLRGPLHGGANEAAMAMIEPWDTPDQAERELKGLLERKEKIMGFGHAIYRDGDPRNAIIKGWSKRLADSVGDDRLYPVSERVEEVMWRDKHLFANADFYHASAFHFMGIPTQLFTPLFVLARTAGWCAHVLEQRVGNRIIRPSADYVGHELTEWKPIDERD